MEIVKSEILTEEQKKDIIKLWNDEYPKDLSLLDVKAFDEYLNQLSDKQHLTITWENRIVGWLIYFVRESEQCFAMLLDSSVQGMGLGSKLLSKAKDYTPELNGWVIDNNEQVKKDDTHYKSPIGFYKKNGFEIVPEIQTKKNNINGIRVRWKKAM